MATGKRAGSRKAAPVRSTPKVDTAVLGYAAAITLCVVAWGYLVYAAIDFGSSARTGSSGGWLMLALASVGAMACLFVGLLLVARIVAAMGRSKDSPDADEPQDSSPAHDARPALREDHAPPPAPEPPRTPPPRKTPPGGRRIARR